ncbi:single-stranded DNA-binding protein [Nocardia transvalensis]|uniref:single-stranded DNA-binding protein n=1 Tax=Nocardia transvalensis TaxID=37333 RepID=UPI001894DE9C|nr:single-stranded DNA-binding protein [Nocardia transvalensis]MBF6333428.1 single-stranded DNA-binding protein [Nocardia transvalensis]
MQTSEVKGFIIGDVNLGFTPKGVAYCNFPVAFSQSVKNKQTDEWEKTKNIVLNATAWGDIAEFIGEKFEKFTEIKLSGVVYEDTYTGNDGEERKSLKLDVHTASGPLPKKNSGTSSGGGWDV